MSYLFGNNASVSPEHASRIPTWVSSSFRPYVQALGTGYTPSSMMYNSSNNYVFMDTLPQAGNCALGGCADPVNSMYAHECTGQTSCGCETPGCGGPLPIAPVIPSQQAYTNTDCARPGVACTDWLSFHNCNPYATTHERDELCPNLKTSS